MNLLSPVRRAKRLFAEKAAIHDFGHWAPKDALEIAAQIGEDIRERSRRAAWPIRWRR